eukprot:763007-Hanusia_phi.AAC.4
MFALLRQTVVDYLPKKSDASLLDNEASAIVSRPKKAVGGETEDRAVSTNYTAEGMLFTGV